MRLSWNTDDINTQMLYAYCRLVENQFNSLLAYLIHLWYDDIHSFAHGTTITIKQSSDNSTT